MPSFTYHAVDREQVPQSGTVEARSLAEALAVVEARDLDVVRIEASDTAVASVLLARPPRSEPPGPMPAAPPRPMPPGVTGAPGGGFLLVFGSFFAGIAGIFIIAGLAVLAGGDRGGLFMIGFPMIHLSIGVGAIWYALHHRRERRHLAVNGVATVADVERVELDRSVKINGRSPFKLEYHFEVGGTSYRGKRSSMNRAMTAHIPDDTIWVLYDPEDPSSNMEWPPL